MCNDIQDLFGQFVFLRLRPYNNKHFFARLRHHYFSNLKPDFLRMLRCLMIRCGPPATPADPPRNTPRLRPRAKRCAGGRLGRYTDATR